MMGRFLAVGDFGDHLLCSVHCALSGCVRYLVVGNPMKARINRLIGVGVLTP